MPHAFARNPFTLQLKAEQQRLSETDGWTVEHKNRRSKPWWPEHSLDHSAKLIRFLLHRHSAPPALTHAMVLATKCPQAKLNLLESAGSPGCRTLRPVGRKIDAAAATRVTVLLLLGVAVCALPVDLRAAQGAWTPSTVFLQTGTAGHTRQLAAGFRWDWTRQWQLGPGRLSGYNEGAVAAWSYQDANGRRTAWLGQLAVIPVLRYRPADGGSPWFVDGGVGATFTTTLYQTQRKRFSTNFNFGDHVAVGRNFGSAGKHELALRVEHYSNAGIKRPNPGENFLQLRYSYRIP